MRILNRDTLLDHGCTHARAAVLDLIEAGLQAADPFRAIPRQMRMQGSRLVFGSGLAIDLADAGHLFVVGGGKATLRMAQACEETLGDAIRDGLIVVKRGQPHALSRIPVMEAAHPIPDASSVAAAEGMLSLCAQAGEGDVVITLISGGSSALLCLPPPSVPLEVMQTLYRELLLSGAPIQEVNTVRKHVSSIKGGRLAQAAMPARVINIGVSDVVGDPLDCFLGPVVADSTTVDNARTVLRKYDLWETLPDSIRKFLDSPEAATPKHLEPPHVQTPYFVSHAAALHGVARAAEREKLDVEILSERVEGECSEVGSWFASELLRRAEDTRGSRARVLVGCGEMTVSMPEGGGVGGPNQEAAASAARILSGSDHVAAGFIGTDGTDGPTDGAGGLVDGQTATRARQRGVDLDRAVSEHNVYPALRSLGELLLSGHTGTNVADLFIGVIGVEAGSGRPS